MNLRHIDPGSTDWMDAMLEGDLQEARQKPVKRGAVQEQPETETEVMASSTAGPPRSASPPNPSAR